MRDSPFIVSLLIGLIVVLVIGGVSILAKLNALTAVYKKELAKSISFQKIIEDLKAENSSLTRAIDQSNLQIENLKKENEKLEKLKEKLEESLKEELMQKKLGEE